MLMTGPESKETEQKGPVRSRNISTKETKDPVHVGRMIVIARQEDDPGLRGCSGCSRRRFSCILE